jgi:hypothetical protein
MRSKLRTAFRQQKSTALRRGIKFDFTYDEWVVWWKHHLGDDWMNKRGCCRDQYVMARHEDKGPYTWDNTKCILSQDNHIEYNVNRKSTRGWVYKELPMAVVLAVYLDKRNYAEIAGDYKITKHRIQCIKQKHYYSKMTDHVDELDEPKRQRLDEMIRRLQPKNTFVQKTKRHGWAND